MPVRLSTLFALALLLTAAALPASDNTVSHQCDAYNNTSAVNGGFLAANGNAATGNVSTLPFRKLLGTAATTRIYAHFMPWSCTPGCADNDQLRRCNGHILTGYDSNDAAVVHGQIGNLVARGADGVIVDYYRSALEDATTMKVRDEAALWPGFEFAVMEDKENYRYQSDPAARAQKLVADVAYTNATYFASASYMRRNGRPVLFIFQDGTAVDWAAVRAGARSLGDPLLIFGNDFDHPEADGAFGWIDAGSGDPLAALDDFYARARAHPASLVWGAAFAGFDDRLASWGSKRVVARRSAQTWLDTFAHVPAQLPNLQLITLNDYDEGTEIESGIDNGIALSAAITGHTLAWSISGGAERAIDSYGIFTSPYSNREQLILRAEVPAGGSHSFDLDVLPKGDWEIFVQAQGQPGVRNHLDDAGRFSANGAGPASPRGRAVETGGRISITTPANCAKVDSPVRVVAVNRNAAKATMQIYLDGRLYVERTNVDHIDEPVAAAPGAHRIAAKAWYPDGPTSPVAVDIAVNAPPVTIALPENGTTVSSPIRVIADETTSAAATAMQIYVDGNFYLDRQNVEHLDEQIAVEDGPHAIAVKAWYADGSNTLSIVNATAIGAPVSIASPHDGATVGSPVHVIADAPGASVMQVYVDGTLAVDRQGTQHLDESIAAGAGAHEIAVKAWYSDGCAKLAIVRVTVGTG